MLNICPILSAAPRTLHSVLTILSALASDRRGESNSALSSAKAAGDTGLLAANTTYFQTRALCLQKDFVLKSKLQLVAAGRKKAARGDEEQLLHR